MAALTSPQRVLLNLPHDHKIYLEYVSHLVFDKNKTRMGELFQQLDVDKSGVLDKADFTYPFAESQVLKDLEKTIIDNFDFDGDFSVEQKVCV